MMKDEQLKKSLQDEFEMKAPADFTRDVMAKIESAKRSPQALLPQSVFWLIGIALFAFTLLLIVLKPNVELPFSVNQVSAFISDFMQVLILPLAILTLLFIQHIIRYWKLNKH